MIQHPIHSLLTPDPEDAVHPSMTRERIELSRGLPAPVEVAGLGLSVLLFSSSARVRSWLAEEETTVVSESVPQTAAFPPEARDDEAAARLAPTLVILDGGTPLALTPLIVGSRTHLPRSGRSRGSAVELLIESFLITAGAMRGPGASGSFIQLAWRRTDAGTDQFMAPVARPALRQRLIATTGTGDEKQRRAIAAEFSTRSAGDDLASAQRGGIQWRLTHD